MRKIIQNKRDILAIILFFLFSSVGFAEDSSIFLGKKIPQFVGESLENKEIIFPKSEPLLLFLGSGKESYEEVREWSVAIRKEKIIPQSLDMYAIAFLGKSFLERISRPIIHTFFKLKVPKQHHQKICFVSDQKSLLDLLGPKTKETLTILLLDENGCIRWVHYGKMTEQSKILLKNLSSTLFQQ